MKNTTIFKLIVDFLATKDGIPQERIAQFNKDIEEGLNDKKILEGHATMEKLMTK